MPAPLPLGVRAQIRRLWYAGLPRHRIAARVGCAPSTVSMMARRAGWPTRHHNRRVPLVPRSATILWRCRRCLGCTRIVPTGAVRCDWCEVVEWPALAWRLGAVA